MPLSDRTEDDRRLITTAARRYYLDDISKVQIATELGVSRFKVARLLDEARSSGIVRIEIAAEAGLDASRSAAVAELLGLQRAVVVDLPSSLASDDADGRRRELARVAAQFLSDHVTASDVLGLPSSRTVGALVPQLPSLPPITVIQLSGALPLSTEDSTSVDVVRDAARLGGGTAYPFYAPLMATDRASARMLRRQPSVAEALQRVGEVTVAVVGVGAWAAGESTLYDLATAKERTAVSRSGAVGEISGAFFDARGEAIRGSVPDRVITLGVEQLRAIPMVIGLALGAVRAEVVRAAATGGLLNGLVCDSDLADALLDAERGNTS